jgi:hypothetical protein
MEWSLRSPDLSPIDFFFRGFVMNNLYVPSLPMMLKMLKKWTTEVYAEIKHSTVQRVWQEFEYWFMITRAICISYIQLY